MAKQRHFANSDANLEKLGTEEPDVRAINTYNGRKPINSVLVFTVLSILVLLVLLFNVFQFEFLDNLYFSNSFASTKDKKENIDDNEFYCEYNGGPVFYNLRTSLGVSYEGSHW